MKKSLLTLAVAAGMVASSSAFAEATVYGHAQVEIGSWGGDSTGVSVEDNARGRIGFKSSEDIGGGMKVLAKAEFKADFADGDAGGGASLTKREMMVGLKTGMGTVSLGRLKSAYKYMGGVKYDPFVATVLEARGNNGMTGKVGAGNAYGHNSFISDSIGFVNKTGAITFWLTYDLDDGGQNKAQTSANGANGMTLGVKFGSKQYEAFFAMANDGETAEYSAMKFGGQFKVSKELKISGQYETSEDQKSFIAGNGKDTTTALVDVQFKMDKANTVNFAFGGATERAGSGGNFMRLAVKHKYSKSSSAWVGLRSNDLGKNGDISVIAVGLQNRF